MKTDFGHTQPGADETQSDDRELQPAGAARAVKISYGGSKSKYAVAFRLKHHLDQTRNLATFKFVPKNISDHPKWNMQARYITLPGAGTAGDGLEAEARDESAEQLIVSRVTEESYKNITLDHYWIKWIYSERFPCLGRVDDACSHLLAQLTEAQERVAEAPTLQLFYSFEADQDAAHEIETAIAAREKLGAQPILVSQDKGRNPEEVERRQQYYEAQLDEDIAYAREHGLG
jgi:hypothetical protein